MRTHSDGSQVKLGDIATVRLGVETYNMIPRFNKQTASIITCYQAPGSNAVELAANVLAEMDEIAKSFPESVEYDVALDSTLPITAGIDDIIETLDMIQSKGYCDELIFEVGVDCETVKKVILMGGISRKLLNTIISSYNRQEVVWC